MQAVETIALVLALLTFVVVLAAFILYRRDPTIRAASLILRQRFRAQKALKEQFGDALEPYKLLMTIANMIGPDKTEYERNLTLIGALIIYEMEKCDRVRRAFDKGGSSK